MAKQNPEVFEFLVIHHPPRSKKEDENGSRAQSTIIVDPERVLAGNEQQALILASRQIPEGYVDRLEEVEICIRPF